MKQHFLRVSPVGAVILKVTQLMPSVCSSLLVCNEERHCVMVGYTDAYTDVSGVFQDPCMTAVILHPLQKHQCTFLRCGDIITTTVLCIYVASCRQRRAHSTSVRGLFLMSGETAVWACSDFTVRVVFVELLVFQVPGR